MGQEPQRGLEGVSSTLSGKESLRLERPLAVVVAEAEEEEEDDREEEDREEDEGEEDEGEEDDNSLRNSAVFGILN